MDVDQYNSHLRDSILNLNFDGVVYAIEKGANINSYFERDGLRYYHLYYACTRYPSYTNNNAIKLLVIIKHLISKGSDIDSLNTNLKHTPLHMAAYVGWLDGITVLLDAGANREVTDMYGQTAADYAETGGHHKIAEYIRSYEFPVKGVNL